MTRHDEIRRSYKALGDMASVYDGIITSSCRCICFWRCYSHIARCAKGCICY